MVDEERIDAHEEPLAVCDGEASGVLGARANRALRKDDRVVGTRPAR